MPHCSVPRPASAALQREADVEPLGLGMCALQGGAPGFSGKGSTFEFPVDKVKLYDPFI